MSEKRAEEIVYVLIALLILLFNSIEIVLLWRIRNKTIFDRLLLSLAFSDALVGVVVGLFQVFHMYLGDKLWIKAEDVVNIFLLSLVFSSTNLIAITVDRFLAVQYPIKHRILSTPKRANIIITVLWLLSFSFAILNAFLTYIWAVELKFILNGTSISLLVFGVVITILYCAIFYLICKRKMRTRAVADEGEGNVNRNRIILFLKGPYKAERSVLFTGCTVAISFIICTYPFAFEFLTTENNGHLSFLSQCLIVLNSLLNPFVYFFKKFYG